MKNIIQSALQQAVQGFQQTPQYQNATQWANTFNVQLPQYKPISPVPEYKTLTDPNTAYFMAREQARAPEVPTGEWPKKLTYPDWMANAPQKIATQAATQITPTPALTEEQYYRQQKSASPSADPQQIIMEYRQKVAPSPTPTLTPMNQPFIPTPTTFKFQDAINEAAKQTGLSLNQFHLLRAGENKAERPDAINYNQDGTIDVGYFQVNVNPKNTAEVERLKDPAYNAIRAGQIFQQRLSLLKDPVLAIASYNLGSGGAVLNPNTALKRAQWVYYNAGIPMPETEFTKNPLAYVRKNMDYYKKMGLFK